MCGQKGSLSLAILPVTDSGDHALQYRNALITNTIKVLCGANTDSNRDEGLVKEERK